MPPPRPRSKRKESLFCAVIRRSSDRLRTIVRHNHISSSGSLLTLHPLPIPGLVLIRRPHFRDGRGSFRVHFHAEEFEAAGLPSHFVQDNVSVSRPGVVRGLHFDSAFRQGKLVGVLSGAILDVMVDLRPDSPSRGQFACVELDEGGGELVWIPPGFAHGFAVLGDEPAMVLYKVDHGWDPTTDDGIHYGDPDLAIPWPTSAPIVSPRDEILPRWRQRLGSFPSPL